jgi:spermidine dehydrogenase
MDRPISRRDFMHGAGALGLGFGVLGSGAAGRAQPPAARISDYPPAGTALRGSHRGSFEVAHELAMDGKTDWGPVGESEEPVYDLVVVGAGVSGLAAAWFWHRDHPNDRILVLDNHDDFGGHAKRNEFEVDGRTLLGHGGSQTIEGPSQYSEVSRRLLSDIGVDIERFDTAFDHDFFRRNELAAGIYFDADHYGVDRTLRYHNESIKAFIPADDRAQPVLEAIEQFPVSEEARREIRSLFSGEAAKRFPEWSKDLGNATYVDLLARVGVTHAEVLGFFDGFPTPLACVGIDAIPAMAAPYFGLPLPTGLMSGGLADPYIHHFPDGNASVARLLVRKLIPQSLGGSTMEDVVTARAIYEELDVADRPVRMRLDSTVVSVRHLGDPESAEQVALKYVRGGRAEKVRAKRCILACYNMVIPHLCPELPAEQKAALGRLVKSPLVYTNVALRNWRAWKKLGVCAVYSPGRWHHYAYLDFPVSLGDYRYAAGPDEPVVIHMDWEPRAPGQPADEQHKEGRRTLLKTRFEEVEREVRGHLAGMLGGGGFDPAIDIAAITVNRWPHGYAPENLGPDGPHVAGRQPFGRLAIANSDAGARAYLDCAIDQAWRAVGDLSG